jgi:hypothetical protein
MMKQLSTRIGPIDEGPKKNPDLDRSGLRMVFEDG